MATKAEALQETLRYVKNDLAAKVITDKYLLTDHKNYIETNPTQMWRRYAKAISVAEHSDVREMWEREFYYLLDDFKFVPGGRIMAGLGNTFANTTLKNCYVLAIHEDSIKGIFDTAYRMAETLKYGGGVGLDISPLRPRGSIIRNAARASTGAVSFMNFYSHITGMIGQNARIGAAIICIDVSHPDIEEFIQIKGSNDLNLVRYANISVKITDEFMHCVEQDKDFDLRWGGKVYKTVKARMLWNMIINYAWKRAEPGLLFWDTTCNTYPAHHYPGFACVATNPCGELAMSDNDSCNLGSMVLSKFVKKSFEKDAYFDRELFDKDVRKAVRFLDNIITLEKTPLPEQQIANDNGRRLGLGFMGLADMLIRLNLKFDSDQALAIVDKVCEQFMISSYDASCDLAIEKGSFPIFDKTTHFKSKFIQKLPMNLQDKIKTNGLRNIGLNAIAPTGSISCIAQCSSSIEPIFEMVHTRKTNLGTAKNVEEHLVIPLVVREYMDKFECKVEDLPDFFVGAHKIDPKYRIALQATVQKYIDQSISNTVNLPNNCKEETIGYYYMEAWKNGLKGITVYRDGSREGVLATVENKPIESGEIRVHKSPKRPIELDGVVHLIKPNGKTYTIFVGLLKGRVFEVFALDHKMAMISEGMTGKIIKEKHKDGNVYNFEAGAMVIRHLNSHENDDLSLLTRLMSTALRHGTPIEFIIDQIDKAKIPINSVSRAIAKALCSHVKQEECAGKFKCPQCHDTDIQWEGLCRTCRKCGYSKCG
jgi:ribonucleoside-diphosphate reductase alpha chain